MHYGIWNTITGTTQRYFLEVNGATTIPSSVMSTKDPNSYTQVGFMYQFTAGDTVRFLANNTIANGSPGTACVSVFINFTKLN